MDGNDDEEDMDYMEERQVSVWEQLQAGSEYGAAEYMPLNNRVHCFFVQPSSAWRVSGQN